MAAQFIIDRSYPFFSQSEQCSNMFNATRCMQGLVRYEVARVRLYNNLQGQVLSGLETYRRQQRVVTIIQRLTQMKLGDLKLG
jgi:hypothetical protein